MVDYLEERRKETEPDWELGGDLDFLVSPVDRLAEKLRPAGIRGLMESAAPSWEAIAEQQLIERMYAAAMRLGIPMESAAPSWEAIAEQHAKVVEHMYAANLMLVSTSSHSADFERKAEPESAQLVLRLPGGFAPSRALVDFWVRGVQAAAERAAISPDRLGVTETQLKQEFAKNVISVLGMIAQQLRYEKSADRNITDRGRFGLRHQIEFCDRFLIIPDEAGEFLAMLREELSASVKTGLRITGEWGSVSANQSGDLFYELRPAARQVDPSFVRSEAVE
jgi:hypothetical protein